MTSPAKDAQGWFAYTQSAGSQIVYVDNVLGSSGNTGLASSSPVNTISLGWSKIRGGTSDWLLIRKGQTYTNDNIGRVTINGATSSQPILVSCYDPNDPTTAFPYTGGALPTLQYGSTNTTGFMSTDTNFNANNIGHNIAIAGLELYCYDRDPSNGSYNATNAANNGGVSISWRNGSSGFIVEGCVIHWFGTGIGMQCEVSVASTSIGHTNPIFNRNIITDQWSCSSNFGSDGFFMDGFFSGTFTENLFDKNGYNNAISGAEQWYNLFNHGLYLNLSLHNLSSSYYINGPVTFQRNIYSRDVVGGHIRCGGFVDNNLFVHNPNGHDYGRPTPLSSGYLVSNNVHTDGTLKPGNGGGSGTGSAQAIQSFTLASTSVFTTVISSHGFVAGQAVTLYTTGTMPSGLSVGVLALVSSINLSSNTFQLTNGITGGAIGATANNGTGTLLLCDQGSADSGTALTALQQYSGDTIVNMDAYPVTFSGNVFTNINANCPPFNGSGIILAFESSALPLPPAAATLTSNLFNQWTYGDSHFGNHGSYRDDTTAHGATNSVSTDTISYISNANPLNLNTSSLPSAWTDPTRSVDSYAGTIGLSTTLDAFMTAARAQRKGSWNTNLTADSVNTYIRAGLGVTVATTVRGSAHSRSLRGF